MFSMCLLTVRGEMPSCRAIAAAISPSAIKSSTARSREVSAVRWSPADNDIRTPAPVPPTVSSGPSGRGVNTQCSPYDLARHGHTVAAPSHCASPTTSLDQWRMPVRRLKGVTIMEDFKRGTVRANNLTFTYLTEGDGPLALCLHGFPDSPYTYRYLLPALAEAGYRAVAPFIRGFAPTELPDDRHHIHSSTMVADQMALHEALGGGSDAILIAHDWGAVGAWGAAGKEPDRWRRCVVLNTPPFAIFGENIVTYDQIKRSFYFWYFQNQRVAEDVIRADNFAFIDNIWADWSPGYDASEDLPKVKECISDPAHFKAALGYYWGQFDPNRFGSEEWAAEQAAAWGRDITQPTLYLHGTQDGCHGMTQEQVNRVPDHCGPGSQSELIEGVGHFLMVQRPTDINKRILEFLAA